jgi:hypothetical protein
VATLPNSYMQLRRDKSPVERPKTVHEDQLVKSWISWDDSSIAYRRVHWSYFRGTQTQYFGLRLCVTFAAN